LKLWSLTRTGLPRLDIGFRLRTLVYLQLTAPARPYPSNFVANMNLSISPPSQHSSRSSDSILSPCALADILGPHDPQRPPHPSKTTPRMLSGAPPQVPITRIHIRSLNCALVASTQILNGILLLSRPDRSSRTPIPFL